MIDFKNKKILITGATGGIGQSLVKKFVSLQGNVLATGTKSEKLDLLKKNFPNISILRFDISEHSKIDEFIENVSSQLVGYNLKSTQLNAPWVCTNHALSALASTTSLLSSGTTLSGSGSGLSFASGLGSGSGWGQAVLGSSE